MAINRLWWKDVTGGCQGAHAARSRYVAQQAMALHDHGDFAEIFWVEQGSGRHLLAAAPPQPLRAGSCIAVPPSLAHGFAADDGSGFTLANVAFPAALWLRICGRLMPWPWGDPAAPQPVVLPQAAIRRLAAWLPVLTPQSHPLTVEAFVLEFLGLVAHGGESLPCSVPDLVAQALTELLVDGNVPLDLDPARLAQRVGWSIDHLNREVKRVSGQTTTGILNQVRLAAAERALRLESTTVTELALSAGFANLAHFYRLFARAYGCTPKIYRRRSLGPVAGG